MATRPKVLEKKGTVSYTKYSYQSLDSDQPPVRK